MLISLRTLINTTLFRCIVVLGFWLYTKYNPEPAKYLLYYIGRDKLGNIEVVNANPSLASTGTIESLSNQLIAERLANIEQLCSRSVRLPLYDTTTPTQPIVQPLVTSWSATAPTSLPMIDNSSLTHSTSILQ